MQLNPYCYVVDFNVYLNVESGRTVAEEFECSIYPMGYVVCSSLCQVVSPRQSGFSGWRQWQSQARDIVPCSEGSLARVSACWPAPDQAFVHWAWPGSEEYWSIIRVCPPITGGVIWVRWNGLGGWQRRSDSKLQKLVVGTWNASSIYDGG